MPRAVACESWLLGSPPQAAPQHALLASSVPTASSANVRIALAAATRQRRHGRGLGKLDGRAAAAVAVPDPEGVRAERHLLSRTVAPAPPLKVTAAWVDIDENVGADIGENRLGRASSAREHRVEKAGRGQLNRPAGAVRQPYLDLFARRSEGRQHAGYDAGRAAPELCNRRRALGCRGSCVGRGCQRKRADPAEERRCLMAWPPSAQL